MPVQKVSITLKRTDWVNVVLDVLERSMDMADEEVAEEIRKQLERKIRNQKPRKHTK